MIKQILCLNYVEIVKDSHEQACFGGPQLVIVFGIVLRCNIDGWNLLVGESQASQHPRKLCQAAAADQVCFRWGPREIKPVAVNHSLSSSPDCLGEKVTYPATVFFIISRIKYLFSAETGAVLTKFNLKKHILLRNTEGKT